MNPRQLEYFDKKATKIQRAFRASKARKSGTGHKKLVPASTRSSVKTNTTAIKSLQSKVNGHVQRGYHKLNVRYNADPNGFQWRPSKPLLIALNDFYSQTTATAGGTGSAYFPIYTGAAPNITLTAGILDRWVDYTPGESLGYAPAYWQWKDQKKSQPSKVGYQPLYTDIRINVNRTRATPEQGDMWIRIDTFHAKKTYLAIGGGPDPKVFNMPNAVGAFANLAVTANVRENSMNPALWTTKTRWIKLPAVKQDCRNKINTFHIRTGFPKKFLSLNVDVDLANIGEQFYQCLDPKDIKWALLSISADSVDQVTNPTPTITMTRKVVYRDSRGAQM